MFCPKCAVQNADDAKFCRGCGVDISLVPQMLTGQLAERLHTDETETHVSRRRRRGEGRPVTIERAVKSFFMGIAFIFISLAVSRFGGGGWWFWLLIPAFAMMGDGVATYLRLKQNERRLAPHEYAAPQPQGAVPPASAQAGLPSRETEELTAPPPSITEGTTRHLTVPVERKSGEG